MDRETERLRLAWDVVPWTTPNPRRHGETGWRRRESLSNQPFPPPPRRIPESRML